MDLGPTEIVLILIVGGITALGLAVLVLLILQMTRRR